MEKELVTGKRSVPKAGNARVDWGIPAALIPAAYMFGGTVLIKILPDDAAATLAERFKLTAKEYA
jgi:hypothetical protein